MNYIIIVAGGKGLRMGGDVPKQFQLLGGRPILMRTIENLHQADEQMQVILVLPEAQQDYWQKLCVQYDFQIPYALAQGGETRFHSVKNGLALVPDDAEGVVGVHDGVRPFVSAQVVHRCFEKAQSAGAVVPVVPVIETLREMTPAVGGVASKTVNREAYRLVQTPQTFSITLLKKAYAQPYIPEFTDDASVVEAFGSSVALVEGNRENIKITTPFDRLVGEALVK